MILHPTLKLLRRTLLLSKAFMSMDLNELDKFEASMNTALGELFPLASESYESPIYIKDKDYELVLVHAISYLATVLDPS
jgi:hypothetical protein